MYKRQLLDTCCLLNCQRRLSAVRTPLTLSLIHISPDYGSPTVACLLQRELGLPCDVPMFDINGACSGFLYGLKIAHGLLADSKRPYALVIGSEVISRNLDFTDRSTCVLFGDGAGAAVVRLKEGHPYYTTLGSRGDEKPLHTTKVGAVSYTHLSMDSERRHTRSAMALLFSLSYRR